MDDDKPGGVSFLDFIETNYLLQKSKLQKMCCKLNSLLFDEDIFHDTILKVNESLQDVIHTFDVYERYLMESFKTNLLREKQYHRNKLTDRTPDFNGIEPVIGESINTSVDFNLMMELVDKKFGKKLSNFYKDCISGYDIKEAMEIHNVSSGYYQVKKITKYLKEYYKN